MRGKRFDVSTESPQGPSGCCFTVGLLSGFVNHC